MPPFSEPAQHVTYLVFLPSSVFQLCRKSGRSVSYPILVSLVCSLSLAYKDWWWPWHSWPSSTSRSPWQWTPPWPRSAGCYWPTISTWVRSGVLSGRDTTGVSGRERGERRRQDEVCVYCQDHHNTTDCVLGPGQDHHNTTDCVLVLVSR